MLSRSNGIYTPLLSTNTIAVGCAVHVVGPCLCTLDQNRVVVCRFGLPPGTSLQVIALASPPPMCAIGVSENAQIF